MTAYKCLNELCTSLMNFSQPEEKKLIQKHDKDELIQGDITRSRAKELAEDVQALIVEELGGAARSFFNIFIMA
ncbi:unnamed protein product [Cochlearia groenlandica]